MKSIRIFMHLMIHNLKASTFNIHRIAFFVKGNNSIHAFIHMFAKETNSGL